MKYNYAEMSRDDLETLMDTNLEKIFSMNTALADLAMMADHDIAITEYEGFTWAIRDLQGEYKDAEKELKRRSEENVERITKALKKERETAQEA